jgi:hypothetical protein
MSTVRSVAPLLPNSARSAGGTLSGANNNTSGVASTNSMSGAPSDDAGRLMARINERLEVHAQLLETVFDVRRVSFSSKEKKKIPNFLIFKIFFNCKSNLRAN